MAYLEQALRSILTADSTVMSLTAGRVHRDDLPQNTLYPAIRYQRISTARLTALDNRPLFAQPRFQIDCYATSGPQALALAAAVRLRLMGYAGTVDGIVITSCQLVDEDSGKEEDVEPVVFRQRLDFMIGHSET